MIGGWTIGPEYGLGGLVFASFLASTVLPGGSEALLWAYLQHYPEQTWPALLLATLGNTAGGMTSWWCGRLLPQRAQALLHRRFGELPPPDPKERARRVRFLVSRGFAADLAVRLVEGNRQ